MDTGSNIGHGNMDGNRDQAVVPFPASEDDLAVRERKKYERCWSVPEYRKYSPGANMVRPFLEIVNPWHGRVIDFGCGDGQASVKLADLGFKVVGVDHVDARRKGKRKYHFIQKNLWDPFDDGLRAEYGFCCDVMEHIPEEKVDDVLKNILSCVRHCFFSISLTEDGFGEHPEINERLHLTVRSYSWWRKKLSQYGQIKDGRDLRHTGLFWIVPGGKEMLTISRQEAVENLENTLKLGLPQVYSWEPNDRTVILLAGGPSLNDFTEEIQQKRADGAALATCNGTHDWALKHGMIPSMHFQSDGRQFNERFVRNPQETCKYILSAFCHPDVFSNLGHQIDPVIDQKKYDVEIWYSAMYPESTTQILVNHYYGPNFAYIEGGSTVATRALSILQVLGFRNIEVYGLDGCYGSAHAYEQPENEGETTQAVKIAGKEFQCSGWQIAQAQHLLDAVRGGWLDEINLAVHGDGMIAWMIEAGSKEENVIFFKED